MESPQAKNERNWRIYWRVAAGARLTHVAIDENMSRPRVKQIFARCARERRRRREWRERKTMTEAGIPYDVQRAMLMWRDDFVRSALEDEEARRIVEEESRRGQND